MLLLISWTIFYYGFSIKANNSYGETIYIDYNHLIIIFIGSNILTDVLIIVINLIIEVQLSRSHAY